MIRTDRTTIGTKGKGEEEKKTEAKAQIMSTDHYEPPISFTKRDTGGEEQRARLRVLFDGGNLSLLCAFPHRTLKEVIVSVISG